MRVCGVGTWYCDAAIQWRHGGVGTVQRTQKRAIVGPHGGGVCSEIILSGNTRGLPSNLVQVLVAVCRG